MTTSRAILEADLRSVFSAALARVDPEDAVAAALAALGAPDGPVVVVAVGKGAAAMARGAARALGKWVVRGVVVVPDGADPRGLTSPFGVVVSAHPIPDARSVSAGLALLDAASSAPPDAVLLALVSGGASSLACAPSGGVTLEDKRRVTDALLKSGAGVVETNLVRRHLSSLKGGGLLAASTAARVVTLVAGDVLFGSIGDVGSGPTIPDASTAAEARAVLWRYAPSFAALPLVETRKPRADDARDAAIEILSPSHLARAAADELGKLGYDATIGAPTVAGAQHVVAEAIEAARRLRPGEAIVRAAEPSLRVPLTEPGAGGRATHVAAMIARDLPDDVVFLAGASDGVDGVSGTGGAIVGNDLHERAGRGRLRAAIEAFDTGPLHVASGTALPYGPTGTNLTDLHVLARAKGDPRPRPGGRTKA